MARSGGVILAVAAVCFTFAAGYNISDAPACDAGGCHADSEEYSALLQQYPEERHRRPRQSTCPGTGNACAGNQCCPGIRASRGRTFPCPTARNYEDCEVRSVRCPGSDSQCSGNTCCPRTAASGDKTFPCPIAEPGFNRCETTEIPRPRESVCPGSKRSCTPNTCCPGIDASRGRSFPCPTARDQGSCEVATVRCPGSDNRCSGNTCCPRSAASDDKTFPCPIAEPGFNKCETTVIPSTGRSSTCPGSGKRCSGSDCCPGTGASGGLTFPCPTSPNNHRCEVQSVRCPRSRGIMCSGNSCCPGRYSDDKTFPCPIAEPGYARCESMEIPSGGRGSGGGRYNGSRRGDSEW